MCTFRSKVESKYTLLERLQTLRKKNFDFNAERVLLAYDFPEYYWGRLTEAFYRILDMNGIKTYPPTTKNGHLSIGLLQTPNEKELKRAVHFGRIDPPSFQILGVEVLSGLTTPYGYVTLVLNLPKRLKEYFQYLRKLVGPDRILDYRTFIQDIKPHVSILMVSKESLPQVQALVPQLTNEWRRIGPTAYSPKFVLVFTKFEMTEMEKIQ